MDRTSGTSAPLGEKMTTGAGFRKSPSAEMDQLARASCTGV